MPRKKRDLVRTSINVDASVYNSVAAIITDPKNGRLSYGALSSIVEKLMRQWLEGFRKAEDPQKFLAAYGLSTDTLTKDNEQ